MDLRASRGRGKVWRRPPEGGAATLIARQPLGPPFSGGGFAHHHRRDVGTDPTRIGAGYGSASNAEVTSLRSTTASVSETVDLLLESFWARRVRLIRRGTSKYPAATA